MSLKGTIVVLPYDLNDRVFDYNNVSNAKYFYIREELKKNNIEIFTQDLLPEDKSDFSLYIDHHISRPKNKKNYLFVNEPHPIVEKNHMLNKLKLFDGVFTWNDDLIDNQKIFKIQLSHDFPRLKVINKKNQEGFCLINSNKKSSHKYENYSLRYEVIKFFKSTNDKFDLYGKDWDKYSSANYYVDYLFNQFKSKPPNVWKGEIRDNNNFLDMQKKRELVSSYKFQFAIENSKNINGYISEKLIDCFLSGTIALYSGCKNVSNFIPPEAFINLDSFKNFSEAYRYIKSLNNKDQEKIKGAAINFLTGPKKNIFDVRHNAKIIVNKIIDDFKQY
jgi:alpha(1,3/1,4) fucosyltransferase